MSTDEPLFKLIEVEPTLKAHHQAVGGVGDEAAPRDAVSVDVESLASVVDKNAMASLVAVGYVAPPGLRVGSDHRGGALRPATR